MFTITAGTVIDIVFGLLFCNVFIWGIYWAVANCSTSKTPKVDTVLWNLIPFGIYTLLSGVAAHWAVTGKIRPGWANPFTEFHLYIAATLLGILGLVALISYRDFKNS